MGYSIDTLVEVFGIKGRIKEEKGFITGDK
jgi:hypothetical protein